MEARAIQDTRTKRIERMTLTAKTFQQEQFLGALWQWAEHGGHIAIVAKDGTTYQADMTTNETTTEEG